MPITPSEDSDILSTNPAMLFPRPKLIESTKSVIDPLTGEILIINEVRNRAFHWEPLVVPKPEYTPEFDEILRMHHEGIPHPKAKRALLLWFILLLPMLVVSVFVATLAGVEGDLYLCGTAATVAVFSATWIAVIILEYEGDQMDEIVGESSRRSARHRQE